MNCVVMDVMERNVLECKQCLNKALTIIGRVGYVCKDVKHILTTVCRLCSFRDRIVHYVGMDVCLDGTCIEYVKQWRLESVRYIPC